MADHRALTTTAEQAITELTGYPAESASGLRRDGQRWLVTVEVCELERVPSTTDVMASYVVELDSGGGIVAYERTGRYIRSRTEGE